MESGLVMEFGMGLGTKREVGLGMELTMERETELGFKWAPHDSQFFHLPALLVIFLGKEEVIKSG